MAIIVQGKKRVTLGRTTYVCDESSFLLTSVDVPLVSEIVAASEKTPLLALFLKLDMAIISEIDRDEFAQRSDRSNVHPVSLGQTQADLLQPCIRLLRLLDTPSEMPVLQQVDPPRNRVPLAAIPQGDFLRAIARLDDERRGTAKALAWLRANYMKPFRLEQLAEIARMGVSTLNHHFRAVTALSPLQYQKQLRLTGGTREDACRGAGCYSGCS